MYIGLFTHGFQMCRMVCSGFRVVSLPFQEVSDEPGESDQCRCSSRSPFGSGFRYPGILKPPIKDTTEPKP